MVSLAILKQHLPALKIKYPIDKIGIFGSYSRGEQTENSDIDIVVSFNRPVGMELIDLAFDLEEILRCKVDLVSLNALKPRYYEAIKKDIIYA